MEHFVKSFPQVKLYYIYSISTICQEGNPSKNASGCSSWSSGDLNSFKAVKYSVQYATEVERRTRTSSSRANEVAGPKPKGHAAADAPGKESPMLQRKILHKNLECKIYEPWEAGCGQTGDGKNKH